MSAPIVHALRSPSKLAIWGKCPGWSPDGKPSETADRGTSIGEIIAGYATTGTLPDEADSPTTYGMEAIASICLQHEIRTGNAWISEQHLKTSIEGVAGYADLIYQDMDFAVLVEIKSGNGDREPAASNPQVYGYVLGLLESGYPVVHAYLIETDKRKVSEATFSQDDMQRLIRDIRAIIHARIDADKSGMGYTIAGNPGSYCRYCDKITTCPAMTEAPERAMQTLEDGAGGYLVEPKAFAEALSPESLGDILKKVIPIADLVDKYTGALKNRAFEIIEAGGDVPGWIVAKKAGRRSWIDESTVLESLALVVTYSDQLSQLSAPVSPAQAEKVLKAAGKKASDIKAIISGMTVQGQIKTLKEAV